MLAQNKQHTGNTMKITLLLAAAALAVSSLAASADTNRAFLGVNLAFGGANGNTPEALVGLVHASTSSSGSVTGVKAEFGMDMSKGFQPSTVKLSGLAGRDWGQGELGLGYNLQRGQVFGLGGINAQHLQLGGTWNPRSGFGGYAGLLTLGKL